MGRPSVAVHRVVPHLALLFDYLGGFSRRGDCYTFASPNISSVGFHGFNGVPVAFGEFAPKNVFGWSDEKFGTARSMVRR